MNFARRSLTWTALTLSLATALGCGGTGLAPRGTSVPASALFAAGAREASVVLSYQTRAQLRALGESGIDTEGVDVKNHRLRAVLTPAQYDMVLKLGVTVMRDARPVRNGYDKSYRTYTQAVSDLRALATKHPELAELVDIGDGWEKTQKKADRDIVALHIGKKGAGKPVVLFAGCHHARELVTPEMVLKMAKHLVDGYGTDAEVTGLVDTRDIWLVPMVNPDGHALAEQGQNQRKNTNIVTGGKSRIGVDLNRNYGGPEWSHIGSSNNAESDTFHGKAGFSEPEVQAMRDLMRRIKPTYLLTFHSFSNIVLWPWGYTDAPPPDKRLEIVGKKLGELSGYDAGQSGPALYPTAGDDTDWAFAELGTLAYTVEIGGFSDGFDPPYSKVAKFWEENRPMMLFSLRTADNPAAAAGPEMGTAKAKGAEHFFGRPGVTGAGLKSLPVGGPRQLVWSHAQDANGTWGPWSITWSR